MQRVFVCVFMSWLDCAERFKGMNETECRSTLTGATGGVEPEPRVAYPPFSGTRRPQIRSIWASVYIHRAGSVWKKEKATKTNLCNNRGDVYFFIIHPAVHTGFSRNIRDIHIHPREQTPVRVVLHDVHSVSGALAEARLLVQGNGRVSPLRRDVQRRGNQTVMNGCIAHENHG